MAAKLKYVTYKIDIESGKVEAKLGKVTKSFNDMGKAAKWAAKQTASFGDAATVAGKRNAQLIDKTGLAGATVQELGRTISDANYGIRGMANNLQQLSSLFVTLVSTSGGLTQGLGQMWKVLRGPLGLVILFQTFIMLIEGGKINISRFTKEQKALNKAMQEGAKSAGAEVGELRTLVSIAKDESLSRESRQDAIDKINETYPEYLENLTLEKINTEETNTAISNQITLLQARAKVQSLTNLIVKENEEMFETITKSADKNANILDYLSAGFTSMGTKSNFATTLAVKGLDRQQKKIEQSQLTISLLEQELKKVLAEVPGALGKSGKETTDKLAELLNNYKQKLVEAEQISKAELLREQRDAVLRTARALGASIKQLKPILDYFDVVIRKAQDAEIAKDKQENLQLQLDKLKDIAEKEKQIFTAGKRFITELNQLQSSSFAAQIKRIDNEREIILNNDNLTSKEKNRLLIENDRKNKEVQKKKIKFDRDIFLIEQGMELAKIALKAKNQMAELAMKGADSVSSATMSVGEFMRQLGPLGIAAYAVSIGGVVASIIAARKKAQQQIAAIAGTTGGISGSAGGSTSIASPAFNVVGATQTSQLAQTIAGSEEQPLRAYVVASDISTAQELERSTIEGASMG
jgi:hypothetical protein